MLLLDDVPAPTLAQVEAWLAAHGWVKTQFIANEWAVWSRGNEHVQVPLKTSAPDWTRALARTLEEVWRAMVVGSLAWPHPPGAIARGMVGLPVLSVPPLCVEETVALADKLRAELRAGGAGPIVPERRKLESLSATVGHLCWLVVEHAGCSEPEDLEAVADVEDALRALGLPATDYGARRDGAR